jgi:hypothetical protein
MHHKKLFALAGVFLAVALFTPPIVLYLQGVTEEAIFQERLAHETAGNFSFLEKIQQSRQNSLVLVAVVEVVFVSLFVVAMYYGINHLAMTGGKIRPGMDD